MKTNKGITLIILVVLIVIMLILLGIVMNVSRNILEKSKGEKLLTYMKLIEARANAYYEEIDFEIGEMDFETYIIIEKGETTIKKDDEFIKIEPKYDGESDKSKILDNCYLIKWGNNELIKQGIEGTFLEDDKISVEESDTTKLSGEFFIVAYNYIDHVVEEVYYNKGIYLNQNKDLEGNKKLIYSMSELEKEMSK